MFTYSLNLKLKQIGTFGPGVVEVLQKFSNGSLNLAAKEMKMSYNKAWRIVRVAEEELSFPLIIKSVGGCNGGGSIVTDQGKELIDQYLLFEKKCINR